LIPEREEHRSMSTVTPIVMPKWGLEMREGTVAAWLVDEGAEISVGQPIIEVETDKISNAVEAPDPGRLRRQVAQIGETLPVKALLGVLADASVSDAEIDAFIAGYVVPQAVTEGEEGAPAYRRDEVGGITVRYARRGADRGVPVLFVHGFGGDLNNWLFNLDAVAEAAPVIALDLPGHGESQARLPGATLAELARFVALFLDRLDVERAHLVGHSLGGAIAAQLALDFPSRVASLVLINSAGLGEEIDAGYIDGFVAASSRRELKPLVEKLFADPALVTRALIDDLLKAKRIDGVPEVLAALAAAQFAGGRQAEQPARRLGAGLPLLVLWGREDRIIPAAHAALAPAGAAVHVIEGAAHMVMMEKASEVNALIKRHLAA
jgi:pyruvate dehydrogenase E2 component (dihydrolipoamide acetyltransferase)